MTTRLFALTWDGELGPFWMNEDNLRSCLFTETKCFEDSIKVADVTDITVQIEKVEMAHEIAKEAVRDLKAPEIRGRKYVEVFKEVYKGLTEAV